MELPTITPIYVYQTVVENDDKPLEFGIALGDLFWKQKKQNRSGCTIKSLDAPNVVDQQKVPACPVPGVFNIGWYHSRTQKLSWKYMKKNFTHCVAVRAKITTIVFYH